MLYNLGRHLCSATLSGSLIRSHILDPTVPTYVDQFYARLLSLSPLLNQLAPHS